MQVRVILFSLACTPTDQSAHSNRVVTLPTAQQMPLHMDKARERTQLKSY